MIQVLHTMDTTNARTRQRVSHVWISQQDGSTMKLGPKRHKKMLSGLTRYWMNGCSTHTYTFKSDIDPNTVDDADWSEPVIELYKPTTSHNRPTDYKVTKKERAKAFFAIDNTRKTFIARCVAELDMTKAGASTYHSNFKKGTW